MPLPLLGFLIKKKIVEKIVDKRSEEKEKEKREDDNGKKVSSSNHGT